MKNVARLEEFRSSVDGARSSRGELSARGIDKCERIGRIVDEPSQRIPRAAWTQYRQYEKRSGTDAPHAEQIKIPDTLPVLALRDIVIFPYMIVPLFVSRERSIRAVEQALADNRLILLVAQRDAGVEEPSGTDELPKNAPRLGGLRAACRLAVGRRQPAAVRVRHRGSSRSGEASGSAPAILCRGTAGAAAGCGRTVPAAARDGRV